MLNQTNGRFNKQHAKRIWSEDEFELVRNELLRLMQNFFLTYEIDRSGEYIIPDRLSFSQPKYPWDEKDNLFMEYEYDSFMPKGIMPQLIVQMFRYITNHDFVWRRGVVLEREGAKSEIIETYDSRIIKIRVAGKNKRDFMTIITDQIDKINAQYEKLKVEKLIPCNCKQCKRSDKPYLYNFDELKIRIEKGKQQIECRKSYEMVNVHDLIDEVLNENLPNFDKEASSLNSYISDIENTKRDTVFVSYSHADKNIIKRVQTHFKVLENEGVPVMFWDDTKIKAGTKWKEEIQKALSTAKVAVLLVSTEFLASEFITKNELPALLKAAENRGATILPIIIKFCRYTKHKQLSVFQAVNDPEKPLFGLTKNEQEKTLIKLINRIEEILHYKN